MWNEKEIKAIMEMVIADGKDREIVVDFTDKQNYPDAHKIVFVRGIRKKDKVKLVHWSTDPYKNTDALEHSGETNLQGLDDIAYVMEMVATWMKPFPKTKAEVEYENETRKQRHDFYTDNVETRKYHKEVDGSWVSPLPQNDHNLKHFVKQSFLDAVTSGQDILMDICLDADGYDTHGHFEMEARLHWNATKEYMEVTELKTLGWQDAGWKTQPRPQTVFLRNTDKLDEGAEAFLTMVVREFAADCKKNEAA